MARMTVAEAMAYERQQAVLAELFAYMRSRGIKRTWLAEQLGISKERIWQYEHGKCMPPEWFIPKACKALDVLPQRFGWQRTARTTRKAS